MINQSKTKNYRKYLGEDNELLLVDGGLDGLLDGGAEAGDDLVGELLNGQLGGAGAVGQAGLDQGLQLELQLDEHVVLEVVGEEHLLESGLLPLLLLDLALPTKMEEK